MSNRREKLKKVAAIAVAYYLNERKELSKENINNWLKTGITINMHRRTVVQSKGKQI